MTNTFKTAIKHNAGRIAALAVALVAFATLLTGCEHKDLDYLYTVDIEDYSYTGSWQLGPMDYLSGLDIAGRFTVTAGKESDADVQALSRFEAEMNKIDPAQMDAFAAGGSYSFRYVLRPVGGDEKALAERTFTNR